MESELFDFMRHIRPKVASTTYRCKLWKLRAFYKYLATRRKTPANVTRSVVEEYLSGLHCSQQYLQAICLVIREFYDFMLLRYPHCSPEENPAAGIAFKPDGNRHLPDVPSQTAVDEIFARLSDADDELDLRNRLMAELAYGSGLRRGELHRLNIEDIDPEENTVRVLGKGNKRRVVPVTENALVTLRDYLLYRRASRGPLFAAKNGRRITVQRVYYAMRDRVGIRPHLLRHACATHLLKNGCGIRVIQELLGHERLDTTYIYTAVEKENLRGVVNCSHPRSTTRMS
jgi:site-specific recombinase XerD